MKKVNAGYVAKWYIIGLGVTAALGIACAVMLKAGVNSNAGAVVVMAGLLVFIGTFFAVPGILRRAMEKKALELEKSFKHDFKFTSHNAIFYIDSVGRFGILWRDNPSEIQLANLSAVTEVHTNDGKKLGGTQLVCCQFRLEGKTFKIFTLRVSKGQLSMKSPSVLEAISKADKICEVLNTAKQAALSSGSSGKR